MAATKYDAMIAALNTIQNITDKPDWMLKEEELELREKMHNDELEMSLMMTQIKTGNAQLDDMRRQIQQYDTDLTDIRARILGTGKAELNKITDLEQTKTGQSTPEEMYQSYDKKYRDQMVAIETNKRDLQSEINKLEHRYDQRGLEFGKAAGAEALRKQKLQEDEAARSKRRLEIQSTSAGNIVQRQIDADLRTGAKYDMTDPASVADAMNVTYADMVSQTGKGLVGPEALKELAINLTDAGKHPYATHADLLANKLSTMFALNSSAEGFLTALKNEDPMYEDFLKEVGMPTYHSMLRLDVLSLSETAATTGTTEVISPEDFIKDLINKLPPLVERKE